MLLSDIVGDIVWILSVLLSDIVGAIVEDIVGAIVGVCMDQIVTVY